MLLTPRAPSTAAERAWRLAEAADYGVPNPGPVTLAARLCSDWLSGAVPRRERRDVGALEGVVIIAAEGDGGGAAIAAAGRYNRAHRLYVFGVEVGVLDELLKLLLCQHRAEFSVLALLPAALEIAYSY